MCYLLVTDVEINQLTIRISLKLFVKPISKMFWSIKSIHDNLFFQNLLDLKMKRPQKQINHHTLPVPILQTMTRPMKKLPLSPTKKPVSLPQEQPLTPRGVPHRLDLVGRHPPRVEQRDMPLTQRSQKPPTWTLVATRQGR